ncbi:hypothetical protein GLYMA_10G119567v4 [Glycine max]|nr:hypothetical protein GLYMA_10G119567v4 [Glycine max]KAH1137844.1 hypothetical protein GYH30_027731 [Glycine max]
MRLLVYKIHHELLRHFKGSSKADKRLILIVFSAVSGVQVKIKGLHENYVVIISCVILMVLFSIQHHGTHRVAFMFAPLLATWLLCISGIGVYNRFYWNRHIYRALSPLYMLKFLRATGIEGRMSLGGVVLSITGVEAMYAALGHFFLHSQ